MSRNTFRLGTREAAHYLALFDAARASIVPPNRLRPFGSTSQAVVTLGEGDMEFDILTDVAEGAPIAAQLSAARSALSQLAEMDDAARALPTGLSYDLDHDEVLAMIKVHDESTLTFRYFATTVNTEWDVRFSRDASGVWLCRGYALPEQHAAQ